MENSESASTRRRFLKTTATAAVLGACQTPGPRKEERPNILFFFPDQHRPDWVEWNGDVPVPTPNLAKLKQSGVDFTNAVVASPLCAPSRACLASGREYEHCGVIGNEKNYPLDQTTYYRLLRDGGYHVMGCGKLDLSKASYSWGVGGRGNMEAWGFSDLIDNAGKGDGMGSYQTDPEGPKDPYYAYLDSVAPPQGRICAADFRRRRERREELWWGDSTPSPLSDEHYCDNWIARNGLELISRAPEGKPWHLVVNFVGPHPPMDITTNMQKQYRGPDRVIESFPQPNDYEGPFPADQHVRLRQNYAAMIENIDRWLGIYVEELRKRGELDNTIIVYSSDHGEMLGDHSLWGKSVPFQASAGVPLLVSGPGVRRGEQSDALVSLIDVTASFLDYGGVKLPDAHEGRTLRPLLESAGEDHRDYTRSALATRSRGRAPWRMVQDHRYKLVEGYGDGRLLFDRETDPWENENLAGAKPGEVERLSKLFVGA